MTDTTTVTTTNFFTSTVTVTGVLVASPPPEPPVEGPGDSGAAAPVEVAGETVTASAAPAARPVSANPTFNG